LGLPVPYAWKFIAGKSTINGYKLPFSIAFNSYVSLPEGKIVKSTGKNLTPEPTGHGNAKRLHMSWKDGPARLGDVAG
jgi:hypothetical protein